MYVMRRFVARQPPFFVKERGLVIAKGVGVITGLI